MEKLISIIVLIFVFFVLYTVFIWLPVSLYAEAECLSEGYPESIVSIGLERYCMTLDGVITIKVNKQ